MACSFTLESSYNGGDSGDLKRVQFSILTLHSIGEAFCRALEEMNVLIKTSSGVLDDGSEGPWIAMGNMDKTLKESKPKLIGVGDNAEGDDCSDEEDSCVITYIVILVWIIFLISIWTFLRDDDDDES